MIRRSLLLLILASTAALASLTRLPAVKHQVAVIAHRGGTGAPENTLAAFRHAIALGVDYIEMDVRVTRDGHLVLMHDPTVDRTTNGKGAVSDLDLAAIRCLDAGRKCAPRFAGERVPTLDETLDLCQGQVNVYLDHKDGPVKDIVPALIRHRMRRHVLVYGGVADLLEWKRVSPSIPVMPSPDGGARAPGGLARFLAILPAEILDGSVLAWTPDLVREAHSHGALVYTDNLGIADTPAGWRKTIAMGVDGIQTDYPEKLLAMLAAHPTPTSPSR